MQLLCRLYVGVCVCATCAASTLRENVTHLQRYITDPCKPPAVPQADTMQTVSREHVRKYLTQMQTVDGTL